MIKKAHTYPFKKAIDLLIDFENQLDLNGIKIKKDSTLYDFGFELLSVEDSKDYFRDYYFDNNDNRPFLRRIIGLSNFIDKIFPAFNSKVDVKKIIPYLQLLNESSIPQNIKAKHSDSGSNKLIELYFGTICMQLFENVELDNPKNSTGKNPDILFDYEHKKWAIACKTPFSNKPKSILDNIKKGIDQIEKSSADTGFVLINIKNIIDHDRLWPVEKDYDKNKFYHINHKTCQLLYDKLLNESKIIGKGILDYVNSNSIKDLFKNKKSVPAIIFFSQTVAGVVDNELQKLALQNLITVNKLDENISGLNIIEMINKQLFQLEYK